MLDKPTGESEWITKDFKPIQEEGGKATALQIAVGYQNMQKGYPPRNRVPCSEFYKSQPGKLPDNCDYQIIFRTLDEKTAGNARMVIVHDSCYPTESLPDLVPPDTLTISMPRAPLLGMANTMDSIKSQVDCDPSILLLVGGMDLIRREVPNLDRVNDVMTETQVERMIELFLKQIEKVRQLIDQKKIPASTILVASPGLSYYSADIHGIFHIVAILSRAMGVQYILTGTDLVLSMSLAPSFASKPVVWRHFTYISHCLPSCEVSRHMTVSVNDLAGRDFYEVWKRLVTRQNSDPAVMESYKKLRHGGWAKTQPTQGISDLNIVKEAKRIKRELGDKENPYSVQAVPRWDTGLLSESVVKSLGMYPEPPLRADPEQRPGGMKNPGVNKVRAAAYRHYKDMCASPGENGYLLWLPRMRSMTVDDLMGGEVESGGHGPCLDGRGSRHN